jgi:hypothetical protein
MLRLYPINLKWTYIYKSNVTEEDGSDRNIFDLYSGSFRFDIGRDTKHPTFFMFLLSHSRRMGGFYLEADNDGFLPYPFQFITDTVFK